MKYRLWLTAMIIVLLLPVIFEPQIKDLQADKGNRLRINEIMMDGTDKYAPAIGGSTDFIELYNPTDQAISLKGYGLSDDAGNPYKYTFGDLFIDSGSYLLLHASMDQVHPDILTLGFSLKAGKEGVYLSAPDGRLLSSAVPKVHHNHMSFGYHEESKTNQWLGNPTPGTANTSAFAFDKAYLATPAAPESDYPTGAYPEPFDLSLSAERDSQIFYTLDGSEPSNRSRLYQSPIRISPEINPNHYENHMANSYLLSDDYGWGRPLDDGFKAVIIRAVAYSPGKGYSPIITNTYLIEPDFSQHYSLPIMSIAGNPDDFFDHLKGIYVKGQIFDEQEATDPHGFTEANYNQNGILWERPVNFSYLTSEGELLIQQDMGIRIQGGYSKSYPQKGLRLFAREDYGKGTLDHPLFPELTALGTGEPINSYKRFILRASGGDWYYTLFRDAMMQTISTDIPFLHPLDAQAYKPVILFLNGEYWGIHNLRESIDQHKLASHYGLDHDAITIIESSVDDGYILDYGDQALADSYMDLQNRLKNTDLMDDRLFEEVNAAIDLENYQAYIAAQTFIGNTDWPGNNMRLWRVNTPIENGPYGTDGKWRCILYDTDTGFNLYEGVNNTASFDGLSFLMMGDNTVFHNPGWSTALFSKLIQREDFRQSFILTYTNYLNTSFSENHINRVIYDYETTLAPEMEEHYLRYQSIYDWPYEVSRLYSFAKKRPPLMWYGLDYHFDTGTRRYLVLDTNDPNGGDVLIGNMSAFDWSVPYEGHYFENIPITLTAVPKEGYSFAGWEGLSTDAPSIQIHLKKNLTLQANFVKSEK